MQFARTEEQHELAAHRPLAARQAVRQRRRARRRWSSDAGLRRELWQALCEQVGVAALAIPEEYDGVGASLAETAVVLEELGAP